MTSHRITSYNVLSSCLAGPDHFKTCNPAFLDKDYRLTRLFAKLLPEIAKQAVINLQEVSNEWGGKLSAFFAQHQYHFFTALYGHDFNGFMGVGIAVPMSMYDVLDVDLCTIGTTLPLPNKIRPGFFTNMYEKCFGSPPPCSWEMAKKRSNRMVSVVLLPRDEASLRGLRSASKKKLAPTNSSAFSVSCYHMPCAFRDPPLMVIHCALAAQRAQSVAQRGLPAGQSLPYILAGDFNIKPQSTMYRLLTEGCIREPHNPEMPTPLAGCAWVPEVQALRSAYFEHSREDDEGHPTPAKEPDFTNYAQTWGQPFIDTLDYIFVSEQWAVREVLSLPHRDDMAGPLPLEHEPSDHILISATLELEQ